MDLQELDQLTWAGEVLTGWERGELGQGQVIKMLELPACLSLDPSGTIQVGLW